MVPGIDPKVDYAFKLLFGSEANVLLLLNLLNAVLNMPSGKKIVSLEILNPFNDKEALDDKLSILDIKARDQHGRQYNIEMQMVGAGNHLHRMLYYWAVLYGDQLHEGHDYVELRETISICFVNTVLFPQVPDYHLAFQLHCTRYPELVYSDHILMHLVELPKFTHGPDEVMDTLDAWCYFLVHGAVLDANDLPQALRIPAVQRAMEVLQMMTHDNIERQRYEARLKERRDHNMIAKEVERMTKEAETKAKEAETKAKEAETKTKEAETKTKEAETKTKEAETKAKEAETKAKEAETKAKEAETILRDGLQDLERRKQDLEQLEQELQKTFAPGLEQGETLGYVRLINLCQRLLKLAPSPDEELLALPLADLRSRAESLEKQLGVTGD